MDGGTALAAYAAADTVIVVSDGFRFVVVRATTDVRKAQGKSVTLSHDRAGRVIVRDAPDLDRGL